MNNKIFILFGGPSSEHDISVKSKDYFAFLLKNYSPSQIEWTKDNRFVIDTKTVELEEFFSFVKKNNGVIINATHGEFGEDGWIQKKLENAGISFSGSNSKSANLSMNKIASQNSVQDIVNTIPTYAFFPSSFDMNELQKWIELKFPLFIKPNAKGSSIGVTKIHSLDELLFVTKKLLSEKDQYLIQPAISGREFSIGTVCDKGKYFNLPATEIKPNSEFFDYKAKYSKGGSKEITPALINPKLMTKLKSLATKIHARLGLGFYSRTDFILGNDGKLFYLETNSLPGMTSTSLLPQQLRYANMLEKFTQGLLNNLVK